MLVFIHYIISVSRVLVLEGIPEDTTEDDLMGFFPEAKSIMLLSHDEEYNG